MGKCRGCIAPTPSCPCFASATKGSCWSATSCVDCAGKYILPERGGACCVGLGHCWDDCGDIWLLVPVRGLHTNSAFLSETNTSLWAHPRSSSLQKGACQKFWHSSHRRQNLHQLLLQGRYTSANGLIAQVLRTTLICYGAHTHDLDSNVLNSAIPILEKCECCCTGTQYDSTGPDSTHMRWLGFGCRYTGQQNRTQIWLSTGVSLGRLCQTAAAVRQPSQRWKQALMASLVRGMLRSGKACTIIIS